MTMDTKRHVQSPAVVTVRLRSSLTVTAVRRSDSLLRLAAPIAPVLLAACQLVSYPPAGSRSDGGPVVSRGVVSHEARSTVRVYRDAAGCESIQTVNRQFRLAAVNRGQGPERMVLEESYDVRHCLTAESASSEAQITAWRPDSATAAPLFRITGRGATGMPVGNLYLMTRYGCCGSEDLATYYSLINGQLLFASSHPPRSVEVANTRRLRWAAFHDSFSAISPRESEGDSSVVGVIQWGDDETPATRVVVRSTRPEAFATSAIRFWRGSKAVADSALVLFPDKAAEPIALEVELVAPGSNRVFSIRIPIVDLTLEVARATHPPDIRLSPGS